MSQRERSRLAWLSRVHDGLMTLKAAALEMGVGYRQAKRLWRRFRKKGDVGLMHGLRGRPSNHQGTPERKRILRLVRKQYADFGPTLAAEQLAKRDQLAVDHETLRRWMLAEGLWQPRRKRRPYRRWRERKAHLGEMVQMDGSPHAWFEKRGPECVLMVMIDDASNRTFARLFEAETTEAAFTIFGAYARLFGLPQSLYVDRDSIYLTTREPTAEEALKNSLPLTQFARAMETLGVQIIHAHSPQAKGRVERRNAVFQDRLVKELRLAGIADLEQANAYLAKEFLPELNRRFTVTPTAAGDWHRPAPPDIDLAEVLCWQETRVVQNDWTLRWRNRWLQVAETERKRALVGKPVQVRELLDGTIQVWYRDRKLAWTELPQRPARPERPSSGDKMNTGRTPWKPPANHPWRRSWQTV